MSLMRTYQTFAANDSALQCGGLVSKRLHRRDRPKSCSYRHAVRPSRGRSSTILARVDWATRKVLSWRLSNTMHADFCVEALKEAIARFGPPGIMNTDQGSQFTGSTWITTLTEAGVRMSMDGRGRCI